MEESEKDLKIQSLLERFSNMVTTYENEVSNLRVLLTKLQAENQKLTEEAASEDAPKKQKKTS